jgi:hypothetical protein
MAGTPAGAGAMGYNTTQKMVTAYGGATAVASPVPITLATGVGTETFTNDTTNDHDYATLYTFPANAIFTNKVYRVTVLIEYVAGTSTDSYTVYLKLGSTDVYRGTAQSQGDGVTRSHSYQFLIFGRAAAGASAAVSTGAVMHSFGVAAANATDQPVNLATNGTLALVVGIDWSGTGSEDTAELQAWVVEELY